MKNKTKEYQGSEESIGVYFFCSLQVMAYHYIVIDGTDNTSENNEDDNDDVSDSSFEDEDEIKEGGLLLHIQRKLNKDHRICTPRNEQKVFFFMLKATADFMDHVIFRAPTFLLCQWR